MEVQEVNPNVTRYGVNYELYDDPIAEIVNVHIREKGEEKTKLELPYSKVLVRDSDGTERSFADLKLLPGERKKAFELIANGAMVTPPSETEDNPSIVIWNNKK